ncbi:hypothetical protein [Rhodohalobacter sp.]|uniref:hypothetical protein n=1 Tax=Rhodohalobacter sp. TaxID=1974210 RepID=UPI002ACD9BF8|nr:hypothetical protein [Rhodohalobacter sp.]MDZ7755386.1 hypothetical protein [Rhodohalobacter sp.]
MDTRFGSLFVLCISLLLLANGCEQTFEPLQKNDELTFSMYGVVDVHGEFSVVRVMPIGERLINTDPESNNSEVFLVHNSTGDRIAYQDSLYKFGGDTYVWNYFSSENLIANDSYRFVAEDTEGRSSYALINLPSELPFPTVEEYSTGFESGIIKGESEDPIVSIKTRYYVQPINEIGCDPEMEVVISHLDQLITRADGSYQVEVNNRSEISRALGPSVQSFRINRRELLVVSSGEDWPELSELIDLEITLPDVINNVEGGVGYVAGVAGRIIQITPPQEPC